MERVELVGRLRRQPTSVIHEAVNARQEQLGERPVSLQTIYVDRRRAIELYADRVVPGGAARLTELQELEDECWRDLNQLRAGDARRPAFYRQIFQVIVARAQLDGSWRGGGPVVPGPPVIEGELVSSEQLLERGAITPEQFREHLAVFHAMTGGLDTRVVRPEDAAAAARPVRQAPPAMRTEQAVVRTGRGSPPPPVVREVEEDVEGDVVDWQPDADAFP